MIINLYDILWYDVLILCIYIFRTLHLKIFKIMKFWIISNYSDKVKGISKQNLKLIWSWTWSECRVKFLSRGWSLEVFEKVRKVVLMWVWLEKVLES